MIDIDAVMERMQEEETLTCPYCGHNFDPSDDFPQDMITYWGSEDGPVEVACPNCDKDFKAEETVRRTYESRRMNDDEQ